MTGSSHSGHSGDQNETPRAATHTTAVAQMSYVATRVVVKPYARLPVDRQGHLIAAAVSRVCDGLGRGTKRVD